ncbi:MAG: FAD-dependent oxidoreductase [Longimicrobiales bacterium]
MGGGPAGLSAAFHLSAAGHVPVVFEARDRVGGRMRSGPLGEAVVDVGVQLVTSTFRGLLRLTRAAGAESLLVRTSGRDALWRNGEPHVIAYGSVASMATSTALPALLKLKLASKYLPFLATKCRGLDANDPAGTGGLAFDDVSIAEWGRAELGDDFVELMVYPFLASYYGSRPEDTTAALYHAFARAGLEIQLYAVRGGMVELAGAWVRAIHAQGGEVELNAEVESVVAEAGGVVVRSASIERRYDAAVLAVPAPAAHRLVAWPEQVSSWLARVRMSPASTLALLTDRPLKTSWFGLSVPRRESAGSILSVVCNQARKRAGLVPEGRGLLVAFPSPAAATQLAAAAPASVADDLIAAVEAVIPGTARAVIHAKLFRQEDGYVLFEPGHLRRMAAFDETHLPSRLTLAGDYRVAPTVEGAVVSGERAAKRLMSAF